MKPVPTDAWGRCVPLLERALEQQGGGFTLADVRAGIDEGRFHFWAGSKACLVTEFWDQPQKRALNLWLMGGSLKELRGLVKAAEAYARAKGCTRLLGGGVFGRRGWEREGRALGFAPRWTIYAKELSE